MLDGVSSIIVGVVVFLLLRLYFQQPRYSPPLPPSPGISLPILDHLYLLHWDTRQSLRKFRKQCGDVYTLQLGDKLGVVIAGPKAIKEGFKGPHGDLFPNRAKLPVFNQLGKNRGIGVTNDTSWHEHRHLTVSTLRDFGMGKRKLEGKIQSELQNLTEEIQGYNSKPFDPEKMVVSHVSNVICSISFSAAFKYTDKRFTDMLETMKEILHSKAFINNFIPLFGKIPGDPMGEKKLLDHSDNLYKDFYSEIIQDHVKAYDGNDIHDFTSAYIRELKHVEETNEETAKSYEQLAAVLNDLFVAGTETTSTGILWSLVCLVNYPGVQQKLFTEIEEHVHPLFTINQF